VQTDVESAEATLNKARSDPRWPGLEENLKHARGVFVVASGSSRGVVIARNDKQSWVGPAFYQVLRLDVGGGAFGGFRAREAGLTMIALAMSDKALEWFLQPTIPGKGGLAVASGLNLTSGGSGRGPDVLLYDLSGNHMPNLDGVLISIDAAANTDYFGRPVTPYDILMKTDASNPAAAPLLKSVAQ
jgi:lipid-binding SYLF domain-containing protein